MVDLLTRDESVQGMLYCPSGAAGHDADSEGLVVYIPRITERWKTARWIRASMLASIRQGSLYEPLAWDPN